MMSGWNESTDSSLQRVWGNISDEENDENENTILPFTISYIFEAQLNTELFEGLPQHSRTVQYIQITVKKIINLIVFP